MAKLSTLLYMFVGLVALSSFCHAFETKEFFIGDWELEIQRNYLYDSSFGQIEEMKWKLNDANETVEGVIVDEKDEERNVRIEFDGPFKGRFLVSSEEEGAEVAEDFEVFAFELGNRSTGCFVSQGAWRDDLRGEIGLYELVVTSPVSFVLTLWLQNATKVFDQVHSITAKKYLEKAAPSFLQRFGMPMAIVGFIVISQFLKSRGQGAAQPAAGQRPRPAAGQETEGGEPRFEELKEGEGEDEGEDEGEEEGEEATEGTEEAKKDK